MHFIEHLSQRIASIVIIIMFMRNAKINAANCKQNALAFLIAKALLGRLYMVKYR